MADRVIAYHLALCDAADEYRADRATISATRHAALVAAIEAERASGTGDADDLRRVERLFVAGDVAEDRVEFSRRSALVGRSVYAR